MKLPLKWILLTGLLVYSTILAFSYFLMPAVLIRPTREPFDPVSLPRELRDQCEEIEVPDGREFMVRGTLIRGRVGLPLIILIPDSRHSRLAVMDRAVFLSQHSYPVLAIDPRGQGQSDGSYCTHGFREVDDLRSAIDHLAKLNVVGGEGVILYGVEGGATVAAIEATADARVVAVILESPFANLHDALVHQACLSGLLPSFLATLPVDLLLMATADIVPGFDASAIDVEAHVASLQVPVLLVHGNIDERAPADHFERVFRRMQHAGSQRLVIPGPAGKTDSRAESDLFRSGVLSFLQKLLPNQ